MEAANIELDTIQIPKRKFEIGHIAYRVFPKDDGGLMIDRHEVQAVGFSVKEGTFMEMGAEVKKTFLTPSINSIEMGNKELFVDEVHFVTLEELSTEVLKNLNRKKLW
jgi:hypothetical protein